MSVEGMRKIEKASALFVVLLSYKVELEAVEAHLPAHRDFLERQYASGCFLLSGRKEPRTGGVILAHAACVGALRSLLEDDPFWAHGIAEYEIVQFLPTMAADRWASVL